MSSRVDVALAFPPLWYYLHVPHELVTLAGYLRQHEVSVRSFDLNVQSSDYFLSRHYLTRITERLRAELAALCQADSLTEGAQARLNQLLMELPPAPLLADAVQDAKSVFREPVRFYNLSEHLRAMWLINRCWHLVSTAHAPTTINYHTFATGYNHQDLGDCLRAARDVVQNPYVEYFKEQVVPEMLDIQPRCIALIYVHPDQIIPLVSLVVALRDAGSRAHVCILGSLEDQVSFTRYIRDPRHPEYQDLFALIDSVILYEAEQALLGIVSALRTSDSLEAIPNLVVWQDGQLQLPSVVEVLDLDTLPPPDYSDIPLSLYPFPEPVFSILSSRGCYWGRCTFCAITSNQRSYRARSINRVLEDMICLQKANGVRWFHFRDMLMSPAYLRRFSMAILDRNLDIRWTCRARFEDAFTHDILDLMAEAGCVQIGFGFEAANSRVLALMDKGTDITVIDRIMADCESVGIGMHMLTIHGFPTETPTEAEETVAFLEKRAAQIDSFSYTDFILFSDTPVYEHPSRFGIDPEGKRDHLLQYRYDHRRANERQRNSTQYDALHQRLIQAMPMPLLHLSHVPLYRERLGAGSWKHALAVRPPEPSIGVWSGQSYLSWSHPTSWLSAKVGTNKLSASNHSGEDDSETATSVVLAQDYHDARVYLDERMSVILDCIEMHSVQQLADLLAERAGLDVEVAANLVHASVNELLRAGFLNIPEIGQ